MRQYGERLALQALTLMFISHHTVNVVFAFATDITNYDLYTGDPYHETNTSDCGTYPKIAMLRLH